jgi:hypothetical protein
MKNPLYIGRNDIFQFEIGSLFSIMLNFNLLLFLLPTHNFQILILFITHLAVEPAYLATRVIQR